MHAVFTKVTWQALTRWSTLAVCSTCLTACLGGSIAQQIASSIITNAADKVAERASNAYDAHQLKMEQESRNIKLEDTPPDPYWNAFVTSGFSAAPVEDAASPEYVPPPDLSNRAKWQWSSIERLPDNFAEQAAEQTDGAARPESSHLVRVEVWNLLIGKEKTSALEKAQLLGSNQLAQISDWSHWQVATGALDGNPKKTITFLIPPDYGKLISGERAFVEIAEVGGLHIARYPGN